MVRGARGGKHRDGARQITPVWLTYPALSDPAGPVLRALRLWSVTFRIIFPHSSIDICPLSLCEMASSGQEKKPPFFATARLSHNAIRWGCLTVASGI